MIDKLIYLLKHSSIYTLATILQKLTGIFLLAMLTDTSVVTIRENSAYNLFIITTVIFTNVFSMGMESALVRFIKLKPERREEILSNAALILLTSVGIGLLISQLFPQSIATYMILDAEMVEMARFIAIVVAFDILANLPIHYYRAAERPTIFTLIKFFRFTAELSLIYIGLYVLEWGVMGAVYGLAAAAGLNFIMLLPFYRKFIRFRLDKALSWDLLRFGIPLIPNAVFFLLIEVTDRYFIDSVLDKATQAAYTNMYKFAAILTVLNSAFRSAFQPIMLREAAESNWRYFDYVLRIFVAGIGFLMLLTACFAIDFIRYNPIELVRLLIRDPHYYSEAAKLPLILLGYVFLGIYYNFSVAFYHSGKSALFMRITFAGLLINIALNVLMIPYPGYGTLIAAMATAAAYLCMALISFRQAHSLIAIRYNWSKILPILVFLMVTTLILVVYPDTSVWIKIGLVGAYLCILYFAGILRRSTTSMLMQRL